jgi:Spy/CpxP family protein refolding chaperone
MIRLCLFGVFVAGLLHSAATSAQEKKNQDPQIVKGQGQKDNEPPTKLKGILPMNWGKIGLSEEQKQTIYRIQGKYGAEIDKLESKIKELKASRDKEMKAVLTPEQKKRLEEILLGKDKE